MQGLRMQRLAPAFTLVLIAGGVIVATAPQGRADACTVSGDTSSLPNQCGPYTDSNILGSNGSNTYVGNDVWSPPPGFTNATCQSGSSTPCQTLTAASAEDWSVTADLPDESGAVQSYPDTEQVYTEPYNGDHPDGYPDALANLDPLVSFFTDSLPASSASYDVGYDIWGGSTSAEDDNWDDEIMVWTASSHGCPDTTPALTGVLFGGSHGVPLNDWNLYNNGSERIWCDPASIDNTSGGVDLYDMLDYLIADYAGDGSLPSDFGLNAIEYGIEFSYTDDDYQTFSLSELGISQPSGSSAPGVQTDAASGVSSSGANLNAGVIPEGASTTYKFDYGTTTSYGSSTTAASAGSGTLAEDESASITGLSPSTTYHYRIEATNGTGTTYGSDEAFTTPGAGRLAAFSVTGTNTNDDGSDDVIVKVWDVTGGSVSNGAVFLSGGYATPEFTLNPGDSGSLILESVDNANDDGTPVTPAAGNATDNSGTTTAGMTWWDGHYTGTVTGRMSVPLGGTDSDAWNVYAAFEVQPVPGETPAIDPSSPAAADGNDESATTASFSPAAGSVLVAMVMSDGYGIQELGISDNSGRDLQWTQQFQTYSHPDEGSIAVFTATLPSS